MLYFISFLVEVSGPWLKKKDEYKPKKVYSVSKRTTSSKSAL